MHPLFRPHVRQTSVRVLHKVLDMILMKLLRLVRNEAYMTYNFITKECALIVIISGEFIAT
jgi:hypothetical protein